MPTDDYTIWYKRGEIVGDLYIRVHRYKNKQTKRNLDELRRFWLATETMLGHTVPKCDTVLRTEVLE